MFDFNRKEDQLKLEIFPKKLKALRTERNFLVEQIALFAGVSTASIRNYEAGTTYPNVERLLRLANFFDVQLDYFFKE
ncbi:helix-turn-helix transcriptional regulator [Enterococcus hirae]